MNSRKNMQRGIILDWLRSWHWFKTPCTSVLFLLVCGGLFVCFPINAAHGESATDALKQPAKLPMKVLSAPFGMGKEYGQTKIGVYAMDVDELANCLAGLTMIEQHEEALDLADVGLSENALNVQAFQVEVQTSAKIIDRTDPAQIAQYNNDIAHLNRLVEAHNANVTALMKRIKARNQQVTRFNEECGSKGYYQQDRKPAYKIMEPLYKTW